MITYQYLHGPVKLKLGMSGFHLCRRKIVMNGGRFQANVKAIVTRNRNKLVWMINCLCLGLIDAKT